MNQTDLNSTAYQEYYDSLKSAEPPKYTPVDISGFYQSAAQSYQNAINAAYQNQVAQSQIQAQKIAEEYEQLRRQTYVNSRLEAIGNNEKAASLGLAGNVYQEPRSGYSETSRIASTTALRNNIDSANRAEQAAKDKVAAELIEAGYTRDREMAQWLAELALLQAQALQEEAHYTHDAEQEWAEQQRDLFEEILERSLEESEAIQAATKSSSGSKSSSSSTSSGLTSLRFNDKAGTTKNPKLSGGKDKYRMK